MWQENVARLATGETVGSWWMTYTPVMGLLWIEAEMYQAGLQGTIPVSVYEVSVYDNRHNLAPGAIEALESQFPDERDRHVRLHGRYGRRHGLVYDCFGPQHLVEFEVEISADARTDDASAFGRSLTPPWPEA